ncbi:MAG: bL35 family ribosomal protein [bacterium]|nr:bL35 family ribosomal protein [bacterium]
MKSNKSILKRIKITKTGKLLRRKGRQNHFNAKESRNTQYRQKKRVGVSKEMAKQIRKKI